MDNQNSHDEDKNSSGPRTESQATPELDASPSFTPGPWLWVVNLQAKQITLQSKGVMSQYVMDFRRWGAGGQPRFYRGGLMNDAKEFAVEIEGCEHHKHWFQGINHPDARLIAAAPALYEAVKASGIESEDACWYDHHGFCQAHGLQPKGECYVELGRAALALARGDDAERETESDQAGI